MWGYITILQQTTVVETPEERKLDRYSNLGEDWTRLTTTYLTHVILETKDIVIDLFSC